MFSDLNWVYCTPDGRTEMDCVSFPRGGLRTTHVWLDTDRSGMDAKLEIVERDPDAMRPDPQAFMWFVVMAVPESSADEMQGVARRHIRASEADGRRRMRSLGTCTSFHAQGEDKVYIRVLPGHTLVRIGITEWCDEAEAMVRDMLETADLMIRESGGPTRWWSHDM